MNHVVRFAMLAFAPLLVSASPSARVLPWPVDKAEALMIPVDSPVQFGGFDKYGVAHLRGRFVLRGMFRYGCAIDCEEPPKDRFYRMDFTPDPEMLDRLPRWRIRGRVPSIVITNEDAFVRAVANPRQYAGLHTGKIAEIRGRASILVDDFEIGIDCDSPTLIARFVRIAKAPELAANIPDGDTGCG